jgi:hypothetical protein
MPIDPNTGQWTYGYDTGSNPAGSAPAPTPRTPGFNNPWYDAQRQQQLGGQGSFQPMPDYNGGTGGGGDNQVGATNRMGMPNNPDILGSGSGGGGSSPNFNWYSGPGSHQPQGYGQYDMSGNPTGSPLTGGAHQGPDLFNNPSGPGPGYNPNDPYFKQSPMLAGQTGMTSNALPQPQPQQQTPVQLPVTGSAGYNPDAGYGYGKYDPAYLAQIQSALEDPRGPYAGRKPGDYGPIGAPDFVLNPMGQDAWDRRFYWFADHPQAIDNPTQPRDLPASSYDYSRPNSVPYSAFLKNAYGQSNAQQTFNELRGVLNADQLQQAQSLFGWQPDQAGAIADQNAAYRRMYQLAGQDPTSDYSVVTFDLGNGLQYGVVNREQSQQAQQARDFYAPGQRPLPPPTPTVKPVMQQQVPRRINTGPTSRGPLPKPTPPVVTPPTFPAKPQKLMTGAAAGAAALKFAAQHINDKPNYFGQYTGQNVNGWTWNGSTWIK